MCAQSKNEKLVEDRVFKLERKMGPEWKTWLRVSTSLGLSVYNEIIYQNDP